MPVLPELADTLWDFAIPGGLIVLDRELGTADEYGQDGDALETPVLHDPIVVQPLKGADRLQLPEGDRHLEAVLIHTCRAMHVSRGGGSRLSSVLLYDPLEDGDEARYIVKVAEPWARQAGMWRCQAVREEDDG